MADLRLSLTAGRVALVRHAFGVATRLRHDVVVTGLEHLATGPAIVAPNHIGFLDGVVVGVAAPRPIAFLTLDRVFTGVTGTLLRAGGAISMPQSAAAGPALRRAVARLDRGELVGIFPEGARGRGRLEETRPGVAWLALASGAPIVPTAVVGTRHTGELAGTLPPRGRKIVVAFGEPLTIGAPHDRAPRRQRDAVMDALAPAVREHVLRTARTHGLELPDDVPPDLLPG